jgi:AraC-like DNA-binding protein
MDVLTDALRTLPLSGSLLFRAELRAPWGIAVGAQETAPFHLLVSGESWLKVDGGRAVRLLEGDVSAVVRGQPHKLLSSPTADSVPFTDLLGNQAIGNCPRITHGGEGPATTMLCGYFQFDRKIRHPLIPVLSDLMRVRAADSGPWLANMLAAVDAESDARRPGFGAFIDRMCGLIFVQMVRAHLEKLPPDSRPWLAGLRDESVAAAMSLIHGDLQRSWSVQELASRCAMSRSAFAARFTKKIGESPVRYLTRWRMMRAAHHLRNEGLTVAQAMDRVGYSSESTFSRAFKRYVGASPGAHGRGL